MVGCVNEQSTQWTLLADLLTAARARLLRSFLHELAALLRLLSLQALDRRLGLLKLGALHRVLNLLQLRALHKSLSLLRRGRLLLVVARPPLFLAPASTVCAASWYTYFVTFRRATSMAVDLA